MAMRAGELEPHHIERLRAELAEVIAACAAYPMYFDFRSNQLAMRPIDRAKMVEIEQFVGSANFSPIERAAPSSPEIRRFIERLIQRYIDINPSLQIRRNPQTIVTLRTQAARQATDTQRRFIAYVSGNARDFGSRRQALSWSLQLRGATKARTDDTAHSGRLLETTLRKGTNSTASVAPSHAHSSTSDGVVKHSKPADVTIPVPAAGMPPALSPAIESGNLSTNLQQPYTDSEQNLADQPTGPMAAVSQLRSAPSASRTPMRELPPDLYQLYNGYLADLEPATRATYTPPPTSDILREASPRPSIQEPARPLSGSASQAPGPVATPDPRSDQLIFWQLRYQLEAYVRRAARSYGLIGHGADPASVLDELRRSGFVDEADLRIAEGVFALTDRVTAQGQATAADYRQALMLYLLYHRSHLGA